MLKKTVFGIMLSFLIISTLTSAFNVQPVKASGTIYIRADGSVDPQTAPISTVDFITYTFKGNIYDEIVIERDNIIVDGAGYTLQGAGAGTGIYLHGNYNVTLRDMKVTGFSFGIRLDYANSNTLSNVYVLRNDWVGIYLYYSNNNVIFGSSMYYNGYHGIELKNSYNNNVSKNAALYNGKGISLTYSENNTVYSNGVSYNEEAGISLYYSKNNAILNNGGLFLNKYGIYSENSVYNIILGNTILGEVFPSYGIMLCHSSENNTISDNDILSCGIGIWLDESNHNVVNRNRITDSDVSGISLTHSHDNLISSNTIGGNGISLGGDFGSNNNIITNNTIYGNGDTEGVGISGSNNIVSFNLIQDVVFGISVNLFSSNNTILYNTIYLSVNGFVGIDLIGTDHNFISCNTIDGGNYSIMVSSCGYGGTLIISRDNIVSNNTVSGGSSGIYLGMAENITLVDNNVYYCSNGIALSQSFNNTILRNNVLRNLEGIYLTCSSNNTISGNKIANNDYGIGLDYSSNNTIYHNNFMDNTHQATISPSGYANCWDNGYPSCGNYWSDYTGVDVKHSSSQDLHGSDGIGDTPYNIDAYNQDRYPLMKPWGPVEVVFDVIWEEIVYPVMIVSNSTVTNFNFSQPDKQISFNVAGPDGTIGFCNVTIPKALLYGEPWTVLIDGAPVPSTIAENATHSCLYFTYTHSTHIVQIIGTWVIAPPPPTYSLTITTTVGGTTTPAPGTYSYTANSTVQVTAIPEANYRLEYWELCGVNVGSANPYTVFMDADYTLHAVFVYSPTYYLTVKTDPVGVTIIPGEGWYNESESVVLTAPEYVDVSTGVRYRFTYWGIDGTSQGMGVNPITVVMDANHTATGHYILQYYLTVSSPYGTHGGEGWYDIGATAYATLNTGIVDHGNKTRRVFTSWGGDASGANYAQSSPITMDGAKTAVANWKTQYLLTVQTNPAGLSPQPTRDPTGEIGLENTWWYDAFTSATLTAQSVTGYTFNYWDVDGASQGSGVNPITVNMNEPHTSTAYYTSVSLLSVSINPLSASILVGQSVTFTSTVSGGFTPYSYQWYLNGAPVSGATSNTWTFTPTAGGIYYIYLKVTDAKANTAQSETARITAATVPVGGYSIPIQLPTTAKPVTLHIALLTILTALFITIKRKAKRKRQK